MPGAANDVWWDELRDEAELPPPPSRSKAPLIAGVVAAVAVAGGVGWWLSSPSKTYFDNPTIQAAPTVVRTAGSSADPGQVRRAYEEFGAVYANSGPEGLSRFTESCESSLRGDPRILDFCLAFDLFADTVREPDAAEADAAQAHRLAMVQAALPGADPNLRVAEVRRLMRETSGVQVAQAAEPAPAVVAQAPTAPPPAARATPAVRRGPSQSTPARAASAAPAAKPVQVARATPPRRSAAPATSQACRSRSTPADRLMCANPTLRVQERRMKEAYERALAAGADPLNVDRAQAEWRTLRNAANTRAELADLYARRTRELNSTAQAAATTPPT